MFLEYPILLMNHTNIEICNKLLEEKFDIRVQWYVNNEKFWKEYLYKTNHNSKKLEESLLCLPTNKHYSLDNVEKLCKLILKFVEH